MWFLLGWGFCALVMGCDRNLMDVIFLESESAYPDITSCRLGLFPDGGDC